ncbi:MAG: alpha/beta fold hydrolase [Lachnotalea sp.]
MKAYKSKKSGENIIKTYDSLLRKWGIPVEEQMIKTCYGDTHIIVCGKEEGMPLVLFHGVGDDSAIMWIYNAKQLSEHFRLYAVDTIGGPGKSVMGKKYDKNFDDVMWIDEILENLKLEKVSLAGVSHGGYLVQLYSLMRPDKVDKAICLASSVPAKDSGSPMKTMIQIFLPEALFPTKRNIEKLIKKLSGDHYQVFTENLEIMEHYTYLLRGFNNMAMGYHKLKTFSSEEVDKIRNKVYYLVGLDDPFEKLGGKTALINAKMNVKFFEGVGHGINHEIFEEINDIIIKIMMEEVITINNTGNVATFSI